MACFVDCRRTCAKSILPFVLFLIAGYAFGQNVSRDALTSGSGVEMPLIKRGGTAVRDPGPAETPGRRAETPRPGSTEPQSTVATPAEIAAFVRHHGLSPKLCPELITRLINERRSGRTDPLNTRGGDHLYVYLMPGITELPSKALHATARTSDGSIHVVRLTLAEADALARDRRVHAVCLRREAVPMQVGNVTSEGVGYSYAAQIHSAGITGAGQTVVVLDDSFDPFSPELLGHLDIAESRIFDETGECAGSLLCGKSLTESHGTAVAEIVADMAPDARIIAYVVKGEVGFENAVTAAIMRGDVDVLTSSVAFANLPPYIGIRWPEGQGYHLGGEGVAARALSRASGNRIAVTQAAGNSGGIGHFATYEPAGIAPGAIHPILAQHQSVMAFRPELGGTAQACLPINHSYPAIGVTWQGFNLTDQDYDIYLFNPAMNFFTGYKSDTRDTALIPAIPAELISVQPADVAGAVDTNGDGVGDTYRGCLVLASYSSNEDAVFHVVSTKVDQARWPGHVAFGSLLTPADAKLVTAVGEVRFQPLDILAPSSSQGPTDDGRPTPAICGYGGVASSQYPDYNYRFSGTSAAAPHVAGAAALVRSFYTPMRGFQALGWLADFAAAGNPASAYNQPNYCGAGRLSLLNLQAPQQVRQSADCSAPPAPGVNWSGCDLWQHHPDRISDFSFDMRNVDLSGANLQGANLAHVDLTYANFANADLRGASLRAATLNGANFENAQLSYTDLEDVHAEQATFDNASLRYAFIMYANLANSSFRHADLYGAWLHVVDLWGTDLTGASLEAAEVFNMAFIYTEYAQLGCSGHTLCQ